MGDNKTANITVEDNAPEEEEQRIRQQQEKRVRFEEPEAFYIANESSIRTISFRNETKPLLTLSAKVASRPIDLIVDTGAEVTVLSSRLAETLRKPFRLDERVNLIGAIPGVTTEAHVARGVGIQIGESTFKWDVLIAPIEEDAILGLDFLLYYKGKVDLVHNEISIDDKVYGVKVRNDGGQDFHVSRVKVSRRTVIPPQTAMQIKCSLENPVPAEAIFQPKRSATSVLLPNMVHTCRDQECTIVATNDSDRYVTLKKDCIVGSVMEFDEILDDQQTEEENSNEVSSTSTEDPISVYRTKMESSDLELPEHLVKLYDVSRVNLEPDDQLKLKSLLVEFQDVFSKGDSDLGCFTEMKFTINTEEAAPVKHKMRRTPLGFEKEEEGHLKKMLDNGIIRKSSSSWASSPVLVRKKDGTVRYCLDYRDLNAKTVKDRWPLPSISDCLDTLQGNAWFSTLDLAAGYWQFLIEEEDIPKTAFLTKFGLFEHVRMAFGLTNAPSFCQRAIELVLRGMTWKEIIAYLDDVLVLGTDVDNHLKRLREVFLRFRRFKLKLKPKKCQLFQVKVPFLGRIVSKDGVQVDPEKVIAVKKYPLPRNTKEVERFLGFVNYHREFIPNYAERSHRLYQLTGKNEFEWTDEHTDAFNDLIAALTSTPVLAYPLPDEPFILDTDASDSAVAAVLSQVQEEKERVICYGSAVLSGPQRNYCTTRKELLAIIRFTRQFRHYLLGRLITIRTDNGSLTWLMRFKNPSGQIARWLEELSQYELRIIHRKGKLHTNADVLSRIPDLLEYCPCYDGRNLEDLPCGGCKYCTRAHNNWSRFDEEVDDVIPLASRAVYRLQADAPIWFDQISSDDIKSAQANDSELRVILQYFESDVEPSEAELFLQNKSTKNYWINRKLLVWKDGILYYTWLGNQEERQLVVLPKTLREQFLQLAHDNILSGHFGRDKTYLRLTEHVYWDGIREDVARYVKSCTKCNKNKKAHRKARHSLQSFHAGYPMERVHMDILGPLQTSKKGNKYLLVMVDQFTKWIEIEALPEQTAENVAKAAVDRFFSVLGCPLIIHTDQGRNFDGMLFKSLCELLQISKSRTTPYRPCSNGQVERYNRTILQIIRCYLDKGLDTWDDYIQQIAAAIRSTVNRHTGFTPNRLMLGREINVPLSLMLGNSAELPQEAHEYLHKLEEAIGTAHCTAREALKQSQKRQKRAYDVRTYTSHYEIGDIVYLIDSSTKIRESKKLKPIFKGPYLVTKVLSPILFKIKNRKKEFVVHHDRIKPCNDRVLPDWLQRLRTELLRLDPLNAADLDESSLHLDKLFVEQPIGIKKQKRGAEKCDDIDLLDQTSDSEKTTRSGRSVKKPMHLRGFDLD